MSRKLHLCALLAAGALSGCGWFDSKSPLQSTPLRTGADRQTTVTGLPPAPNRGNYDASVAPVDDSRSQQIGAIVAHKGGQKAQIEAAEKDRAERDKERAQREAELDKAKKEADQKKESPPAAPPSGQTPAAPAELAPPPVPAPAPAAAPEPPTQ